jgi:hypothetical protein
MKNATKLFYLIFLTFISFGFAEDGMKEKFKNIQMNINQQNYIIFEDESLIICDRESDKYLVEITPEIDLYIKSRKVDLDAEQKSLVREYYEAQQILFNTRNSIGAKGLHIGIESAKLAVAAVGGAVELALSGFDESVGDEFEQEMESKAERIEEKANDIEDDADEFDYRVVQINKIDRKISRTIDALNEIDLSVDEDRLSIDIN